MKYIKAVFLLTVLSITSAFAQLQRIDFPLQRSNGVPYRHAWAGGLNNPQFSEVDLDGDLIKDLLVFDRSGNVCIPFTNGGLASTIDYNFAPQYKLNFPTAAQRFVLLRDFNCDGIEDLFTYYKDEGSGETGMSVYKAFRDGLGKVQYQMEVPLLRYTDIGQSFLYNLYVSNIDLPDINDIDDDGDLDILNFHIGGGHVQLFNNTSVENGWGCDSLKFELVDDCWGRFYESGITTSLDLSPSYDSCANWAGWSPLRNNGGGPRHAGSTLLSLDMDNDGLKELILGDIAFDNLLLTFNSGNLDTALVLSQQTSFPTGNPVSITAFPAAFYVDVDNDGKKDLIASPNADDISVNDRVAWRYQNSLTTAQPFFNFEQQDFLVNEMLDVGSTAAPAFTDFNGDGLLDLIVGNYGIFINASTYRTRLLAFENVGTSTSPIFRLAFLDFANLQQYNLRRIVPTFGDMDNDGDQDMILGQEDGTLVYLTNNGNASSPSYTTPVANYSGIDVGQHAVPQLIDMDRDGDLDLVIGERNGNTNYCQNIGTVTSPMFSAGINNQAFGQIDTRILNQSLEGNSAPQIVDDNGSFVLFMGNEAGQVWSFDSLDGNLSGSFHRLSSELDEVKEGRQSILAIADLNNDGQPEFAVGNKRGGVAIFSSAIPSSNKLTASNNDTNFRIWPNPAKEQITLEFETNIEEDIEFRLTDALGRTLLIHQIDFGNNLYNINLPNLSDGIYYVSISNKNIKKNIVIKIKN